VEIIEWCTKTYFQGMTMLGSHWSTGNDILWVFFFFVSCYFDHSFVILMFCFVYFVFHFEAFLWFVCISWIYLSVSRGGSGRNWEREKHNQNILYKNVFQ
jgi:hypothetical protein